MFTINGKEIKVEHFPDGTQKIDMFLPVAEKVNNYDCYNIFWSSPSDAECMTLYFLVNHIRNIAPEAQIILTMPYILNARMDRVQSFDEVFTLKYFCKFINDMNFFKVYVLDAHSNVSLALLNNVRTIDVNKYVKMVLDDIEGVDIDGGVSYGGTSLIYFPDDGAMKRYSNSLWSIGARNVCYGKKNRDWKTGKILGLDVHNRNGDKLTEDDVKGKTVLMIDDIISYGGTLAYSADELKKLGASAIYAYASHVENSVLDEEKGTLLKRLENGTVDGVFTTNSIFTGDNDYFIVYDLNPHIVEFDI
jgi:ribose-phosphate pyrophosphokinase